jgi:hypothetical protein
MMFMSKREGLKKQKKSTKVWEIVDDILVDKTGTLLEDATYEKDFNAFLIIRYLSMNPELAPYCNYLNRLHDMRGQKSISKKQFYKLMIKLIPRTEGRFQYIKSAVAESPEINNIMEYFECNRREASLYLELHGPKWAEEITKEFGGSRK